MTTTKQEAMPEAVSSVTYTLESRNGFPLLFTVRGSSGAELLKTMPMIETTLIEEGYKPQIKQYGPGRPKKEVEAVPNRTCPKCGSPLVYFEAKGKKHIKCSTQKYNFQTKQSEGCDFIEWST